MLKQIRETAKRVESATEDLRQGIETAERGISASLIWSAVAIIVACVALATAMKVHER